MEEMTAGGGGAYRMSFSILFLGTNEWLESKDSASRLAIGMWESGEEEMD